MTRTLSRAEIVNGTGFADGTRFLPVPADDWYPIYRELQDVLDAEGHDEECVYRCLRVECNADHACKVCGWEVPE